MTERQLQFGVWEMVVIIPGVCAAVMIFQFGNLGRSGGNRSPWLCISVRLRVCSRAGLSR
ncbi:MAG: hypothetical protein Ct9H300mP1_21730 [Planctomycetaceae bacterium]|nr:MAG: hypothetical protein Ct9H300mP1_21730 [Planctomycetaceae bacterium]